MTDYPEHMDGADLIARERDRQVSEEGWTPEHDDHHDRSEMARAALGYTIRAVEQTWGPYPGKDLWPWDPSRWKPSDDPVRNLVKAGALVAAEIDRLLRARRWVEKP